MGGEALKLGDTKLGGDFETRRCKIGRGGGALKLGDVKWEEEGF